MVFPFTLQLASQHTVACGSRLGDCVTQQGDGAGVVPPLQRGDIACACAADNQRGALGVGEGLGIAGVHREQGGEGHLVEGKTSDRAVCALGQLASLGNRSSVFRVTKSRTINGCVSSPGTG